MLYPSVNEDAFYSQPEEVRILIKHFEAINSYKPFRYSLGGTHTAQYAYSSCLSSMRIRPTHSAPSSCMRRYMQ